MKTVTISFLIVFLYMTSDKFVLSLENVTSSTETGVDRLENALCKEPGCIMKCCPIGKHFAVKKINRRNMRFCADAVNTSVGYINLLEEVFQEFPNLWILNNMTVKSGIFEADESFKKEAFDVTGFFNLYLTELPELLIEHPNAYKRWTYITNDKFCWDYKLKRSGDVQPRIWVKYPKNELEYKPSKMISTYTTACVAISCFFLLLVMVVYGILHELLTLDGKILLAYAASFFGAFLFLTAIRLKQQTNIECLILTYLIHFFFLASFCWTNVMSYEIWINSRNNLKFRPTLRRGRRRSDCCLMLILCLYAFGLPLVLTTAMAIINHIDMTHMPWFITPKVPTNGCFLEDGEKYLYLYVPMLILLAVNGLFLVMTAVNMWRLRRRPAKLILAEDGTEHQTRLTYLILLVVLSLSWVLEVVSFRNPGYKVWLVTDTFNNLTGVTVFLISVCRRKVFNTIVNKCRPSQIHAENTTSKLALQIQDNY